MSMNFSSDGLPLKVIVQDYVQRKIDSAIGPFEDFVKAVDIRIVDVNGPKGGIDQRCRVAVAMNGKPDIVASANHENAFGAISLAVDRVRRSLQRVVGRNKSKRSRKIPLSHHGDDSNFQETVEFE